MIHIRWQGGVNAKAEQISGAERVGLVQQKSCKEVCIGTQAEGSTYCVQTLFLIPTMADKHRYKCTVINIVIIIISSLFFLSRNVIAWCGKGGMMNRWMSMDEVVLNFPSLKLLLCLVFFLQNKSIFFFWAFGL